MKKIEELAKMEAMGQMGNPDEAFPLPDNVPFSIDDLELEDDGKGLINTGGFVPPQNVGLLPSQLAPQVGINPPVVGQPVTPTPTLIYINYTQQFVPNNYNYTTNTYVWYATNCNLLSC